MPILDLKRNDVTISNNSYVKLRKERKDIVSRIIETTSFDFILLSLTILMNLIVDAVRHHTMLNIRHHELRSTSSDSTLHNRNI